MARPIRQTITDYSPELAAEWGSANTETPQEVSSSSRKRYWWLSPCGHEWETSPALRKEGTNCVYCSGRAVLPGFNDLATVRPDLIIQWHPTKNAGTTPQEMTRGSRKKIWWICDEGHEWESPVKNRTILNRGCAICAGKKVWIGKTDLTTVRPELAAQWHPTKNDDLLPSHVSTGTDRKVWWLGECNHEWQSRVSERTSAKQYSCPYCSGQLVQEGYNDLQTTHPELASEFHPAKNAELLVTEISTNSSQRVWWLGKCGHEWDTRVCDRVRGRYCPTCAQTGRASRVENELADFIRSLIPDETIERNTRSILDKRELDIYLPDRKLAIEFNGVYWHSDMVGKSPDYHYAKWKACQDAGVQLIQVWEDDWRDKKSIVKSMLAHKLGVSGSRSLGARSCRVEEIDKKTAESILKQNHINGFVVGTWYLALVEKETNSPVAVMVLRKEKGNLFLSRYVTTCRVVGGQSKMLSWVDKNIAYNKFITYADHEVSDGELYEKTGWEKDKELDFDYKYVYGGKRVHKFGFRRKRFQDDPGLVYDPEKTESGLAVLNNIPRVWDSGKTRYVRYSGK